MRRCNACLMLPGQKGSVEKKQARRGKKHSDCHGIYRAVLIARDVLSVWCGGRLPQGVHASRGTENGSENG